MIVADTCLLFHLFNETALTESAQKVLDKDPIWKVPQLWKEEYANVLSKLARKESRTLPEVLAHFEFIVSEIEPVEIIVEARTALEFSIKHKISVYDAHFVTLAVNLNTILVTEDREIIKKCPKLAIDIADFLKKF